MELSSLFLAGKGSALTSFFSTDAVCDGNRDYHVSESDSALSDDGAGFVVCAYDACRCGYGDYI